MLLARPASIGFMFCLISSVDAYSEARETRSTQPLVTGSITFARRGFLKAADTAEVDLPELSVSAESPQFKYRTLKRSNWDPRVCTGC